MREHKTLTMAMPPATCLKDHGFPRRSAKTVVRNGSSDHAIINDTTRAKDLPSSSQYTTSTTLSPQSLSPISRRSELTPHQEACKTVPDRQTSLRRLSKKKSSSVLNFLALKEPSTSAFEGFAEQERRKASRSEGRATAVIMSGVSSQRLPDHVPKVNSKWDGLPPATKCKTKDRVRSTRSSTISTSSNESSSHTRSSSEEKGRAVAASTFLDPPSPVSVSHNETFLSLSSPVVLSPTSVTSKSARRHSPCSSLRAGDLSSPPLANTSWLSDADAKDGHCDAPRAHASTFLDNATTHRSSQRHVTYADQTSPSTSRTYSKSRTGSSSTSSSAKLQADQDRERLRILKGLYRENVPAKQPITETGDMHDGMEVQAVKKADVLPSEMFEAPRMEGEGPNSAASSIKRLKGIVGGGAASGPAVENRRDYGSEAGGRLKRFGRSLRSK